MWLLAPALVGARHRECRDWRGVFLRGTLVMPEGEVTRVKCFMMIVGHDDAGGGETGYVVANTRAQLPNIRGSF